MTHRRFNRLFSKFAVWAMLAIPAGLIAWQYAIDALTYGGAVHQTGLWSAGLLALVLSVTPICKFWPKARLSRFLRLHRRALGVASFGYAGFHAGIYLWRKIPLGKAAEEAARLDMLTGWIAFAIFIALAATSNNQSVRLLGRRWQTLHRAVYLAAALTALHWALASFDYGQAAAFAGFIAAIEIIRLALGRKLTAR